MQATSYDTGRIAEAKASLTPPVRRQSSRQRILAAARRILSSHSFDGFALEDLATEAGVPRRTISNPCDNTQAGSRASREALFTALAGMIPARINPALPPGPALSAFAAAVADLMASEEHIELITSLIRDRGRQDWLVAAYDRYVADPIRGALEIYFYAKRDAGEIDCSAGEAAQLFFQLIQSVAVPIRLLQHSDREARRPSSEAIKAIVRAFLIQHETADDRLAGAA